MHELLGRVVWISRRSDSRPDYVILRFSVNKVEREKVDGKFVDISKSSNAWRGLINSPSFSPRPSRRPQGKKKLKLQIRADFQTLVMIYCSKHDPTNLLI